MTSTANSTTSKTRLFDIGSFGFPISMAFLMVYGMELYNYVLMGAPLVPATLLSPFSELLPMAIAVLVVEKFAGSYIVEAILFRIDNLDKLALPHGIILGAVTCIVMCPMMSMIATFAFKHPSLSTLAPLWFGTFCRNLPFALAWSLLIARPVSGAVVGKLSA